MTVMANIVRHFILITNRKLRFVFLNKLLAWCRKILVIFLCDLQVLMAIMSRDSSSCSLIGVVCWK